VVARHRSTLPRLLHRGPLCALPAAALQPAAARRGALLPARPAPRGAHLHDAQGGRGDRVGEVAAGGRHGAHDGDAALALGAAQAGDAAGALVEGGQARAQVGGVAAVRGHLGQAARDLPQRLRPARGRVAHHGEVVAHVAEVLAQRDARVDGRLARGHRHVGGVGHLEGGWGGGGCVWWCVVSGGASPPPPRRPDSPALSRPAGSARCPRSPAQASGTQGRHRTPAPRRPAGPPHGPPARPPPPPHQAGALHDRLLAAVGHGHGEGGELGQHLGHLVAALAAAHVDDAVRVGVLGEGLRDDGLAAAKGAGDGAGAWWAGGEGGRGRGGGEGSAVAGAGAAACQAACCAAAALLVPRPGS
jgi:hypothetical protein